MGNIIQEQRGSILILTIDNQRKRNAIDSRMSRQLLAAFRSADADASTRAVVVTGAGDIAFCSGHDVTEIASGASMETDEVDPCVYPTHMRLPVIAAVNGHSYAFGLLLALVCDLRVASTNATFCQSGARLGMLPEGGQLRRLPQVLPEVIATEMMITAQPMRAERAYALGFLNRLVLPGAALKAALDLATHVVVNSPDAVQTIKRGIQAGRDESKERFDAFEAEAAARLKIGPDAKEGIAAFLGKRAPSFLPPQRGEQA